MVATGGKLRSMDEELLRKLIRAAMLLEAGSPGPEHVRLQSELERWATDRGFRAELADLDGKEPDVARTNGKFLFIGDAKDAASETMDNDDSAERFGNYFRSFARRVLDGSIEGGFVAVATNTKSAARGWATLMTAAIRLGGIRRADGGTPALQKVNETTWIAWW